MTCAFAAPVVYGELRWLIAQKASDNLLPILHLMNSVHAGDDRCAMFLVILRFGQTGRAINCSVRLKELLLRKIRRLTNEQLTMIRCCEIL